jgi:CheY-like chemotaxis protein/anti-sigma regulatory factor (Ser/Thr protein kinase)
VAFDKGLELRFHDAGRHARADPLLVERILRNLVANAIRYTEDGGVLVGVRQRGAVLRVQVWDTGVGIGGAEQQRVFEEFYQVGRNAAPTPDQKKGLGLGLAIVKRLAGLMQAPLALASAPGRGSVFTLELPAAEAPAPSAALAVPSKPAPALTLDGRRIVVVEDEAAVRHGLDVLLRSWGAEVDSFDTVAASVAWAALRDPRLPPPDLLIVDYRMEDGATGIDAIEALRGQLGPRIPAIVVTGSTMSMHDAEAERHDFHLMVKPVVPNRLRAMIGFKLGVR